jgi:outer membrane protein OmpA-like peptidoglycan-associated protein
VKQKGSYGSDLAEHDERGELMKHGRVPAVFGAVVALSLIAGGCATKKHVREAIAPVQNQVNDVQKQTQDNRQAIGDLDRQVATADEKATDAGKRAQAAADAAANANNAALQAKNAADSAAQTAQQAQQGVSQTNSRMEQSFQNLDNYKLISTEEVHFGVGRSLLTKEDQAKLDSVVQNLGSQKTYLIEIEGFADRTGSKAYNMELARRRADAVVHYLAVEKNVPLRDIRVLGVGSDFPNADNKTRAARAENRRVDVKVYALDINGTMQSSAQNGNMPQSTSQADRLGTQPRQ